VVALPPEVRVKISSEAAGAIAMAEVAIRTLPIRDLVEQMLGAGGKDAARIEEILRRGSLVAGESRLRWEGFPADDVELGAILATFPDPDPARPFDSARCFHVQLLAGREKLDIPRKIGAKRRLFRRRSFWDVLMDVGCSAEYVEYSYKLRCDHYRLHLDLDRLGAIQEGAALLPYQKLRERVAGSGYDSAEFFVSR
jgi:hypothetical protein